MNRTTDEEVWDMFLSLRGEVEIMRLDVPPVCTLLISSVGEVLGYVTDAAVSLEKSRDCPRDNVY